MILYIIIIIIMVFAIRLSLINDLPLSVTYFNRNQLRTGDVIVTCFGHPPGRLGSIMMGTPWNHTAIVLKQGEKTYLVEGALYGGKYNGVFIIPIGTWLKIHHRDIIVGHLRLSSDTEISSDEIRSAVEKYKDRAIDNFAPRWIRFLFKKKWSPLTRHSITCHELTIALLQDVGVYRKTHSADSYKPWDIVQRNIPTQPGRYFLPVVELVKLRQSK